MTVWQSDKDDEPAVSPVALLGRYSVLHDFLLLIGGAEKLVDVLATALASPLVVGFSSPDAGPFASESAYSLHALGPVRNGRLARYLVNAYRFVHIDRAWLDREAVIYSGVIAPMAVHHQKRGRRIYYCHSPPRFLYDLKPYYLSQANWLGRLGLQLFEHLLRPRYERAVREMDVVVANSENVRRRLKHYLGVDAVVVHPPIDTDRYHWIEAGDYFLSTARLEDFKRVDAIIEAFRQMPDQRLVVASGGSQEAGLRKLATGCSNIEFTSWVTDDKLADLVGRCRAVVYVPIDEDFGMSPVEAMAAGKPVIGVAEGGLRETVIHELTGLLSSGPLSVEWIVTAVRAMTSAKAQAMRQSCEQRAALFAEDIFVNKIRGILKT
jgi:glycosyltransferase involved in cell wall biosynthesis